MPKFRAMVHDLAEEGRRVMDEEMLFCGRQVSSRADAGSAMELIARQSDGRATRLEFFARPARAKWAHQIRIDRCSAATGSGFKYSQLVAP